ncbi:MAG: ornithine carbamoyltransferase [Dissulfurispiraceae bacterium]|jgi:ornithine carbamoyltransferase|nr:ornithine carbamoyltransferase [Dissulfurispiraceae bacterium]
MKRDLLKINNISSSELEALIQRAVELKSGKDISSCPLIGKSVGLFFEKPSTRTRVSFEVGVYQLGGQPIYLTPKEIQLNRGESIPDTAKVLSRYLSALVLRTYRHATIEDFASFADIPVINGLSDLHHPCQALADLMTIYEKKGSLSGIRLTYVGDGNNVVNSLMEAAAKTGMELVISCPEGYDPNPEIYRQSQAANNLIKIIRDPHEAADMADVLYTDVWISMGQENEADHKRQQLRGHQLNSSLLQCAKKDAIVMHCLPAHRGEEITDEVMDSPQSVVFDQAENRLHTEKALLEFLIS